MATKTVKQTIQIGGGQARSTTFTVDVGAQVSFSEVIPISKTDLAVAVAFPTAGLKYTILQASGGALTVETNDGAAPDDTFPLADTQSVVWVDGTGFTNPIGAAVESLFVTNGSATLTPTLSGGAGWDPTP